MEALDVSNVFPEHCILVQGPFCINPSDAGTLLVRCVACVDAPLGDFCACYRTVR